MNDWSQRLPEYIQLDSSQVERLELIRCTVGVSSTEFFLHICSNHECRKMLQRFQYARMKNQNPGQPETLYLANLILQRLYASARDEYDVFGLKRRLSSSWAEAAPDQILPVVLALVQEKGWRNVEELAEAVIDDESTMPGFPGSADTAEARRQVTLILREGSSHR